MASNDKVVNQEGGPRKRMTHVPNRTLQMTLTALAVSVLIHLVLAQPGTAQTPAAPSEEAELAQGRALLAQGATANAATLAKSLLTRFPRSAAVLLFAVDADIARSGALAGLDTYERWLGASTSEDNAALRQVARAVLREAAVNKQNAGARLEARRALAEDGDPDITAELDRPTISGADPEAGLLASLGNDKAVTALIAELENPVGARRAAIAGLAASHSKRAARPLIVALSDPNPDIRAVAAEALGTLGATEAVTPLKPLLDDPVFTVHFRAAAALFLMNDLSALPWFRQLEASDQPAGIRLIAVQATKTKPDGAWLELVRALAKDADPELRREAAELLAPHDPATAKAVLDPLLTHANPAEREAATTSYVQYAANDLATLRRFLHSGDGQTRLHAAGRLVELTR